ncbi:MAG TPA: DUF4229 domain-containing protein [Pseudolysinimonas sp.]|nr:DUF4229 domain-containing protein [Pseudolysinimonas sp.]
MRPWITYTLLRLGLFAVSLIVLMLIGVPLWLAAILAAAIGFCVSYIFFPRLRERVAVDLAAARTRRNPDPVATPVGADESAEDR